MVEAFASKCVETSMATATFINSILSWLKIMNVKSVYEGSRLRDELRKPFLSPDDARMKFLIEFVEWLKLWGDLRQNKKSGCLSKPTLRALMQTTTAMCNIIRYVHLTLSFNYLLTGKVQTDNLERRFGLYMQLSGANYHVSVVPVLEAEKKFRVSSLFALRSAKHGFVNIRNVFDDQGTHNESGTSVQFNTISDNFENVVLESLDMHFSCDERALVYVVGYVASKCASILACAKCKAVLVTDKQLNS
jgi:hypothetical protein